MIVPSIDIMDGRAVQLVGGEEFAMDCGDPVELARTLSLAGEVAVIDLDAALGRGNNAAIIREMLPLGSFRVGGGIRSLDAARSWLDAGADKIIIGTAAEEDLLKKLPRERVIVALDAREGEVVVEGWRRGTGMHVIERMQALAGLCCGFLVTFVENEGRLTGLDDDKVGALMEAHGRAALTIAGGIRTAEEIAILDRQGLDAQVGMAFYRGDFSLAEGLLAPFEEELIPTVVCDESERALGLVWSNRESVTAALDNRRGVYWSRSRNALWFKGETSGAVQELVRIEADCDRDVLRFVVRQEGTGFCHKETAGCWGDARGLKRLMQTIRQRAGGSDPSSYSLKLLTNSAFLGAKLEEEANELAQAETPEEVLHESADLLYFTMVAMARAGLDLADVEKELDRRAKRVSRRPGPAKRRSSPYGGIH